MRSAVGYIRTSDPASNPDRQRKVLEAWCDREDVVLEDLVVDEGSPASKEQPFKRPLFVDACQLAQDLDADALILENPDRLTRLKSDYLGWVRVELARHYQLDVWFATNPLELHDQTIGRLLDTARTEQGHAWVQDHARRVQEGMERAQEDGVHVGRPPKMLKNEELHMVAYLRDEEGLGYRKIAKEVSRARGAFEVASDDARRRRMVSRSLIQRLLDGDHEQSDRLKEFRGMGEDVRASRNPDRHETTSCQEEDGPA